MGEPGERGSFIRCPNFYSMGNEELLDENEDGNEEVR